MSPVPYFYYARADDPAEVPRALRICLAGLRPPGSLCYHGGSFAAWTNETFLQIIAPHAIAAQKMALRGDSSSLARADLALPLPPSSAEAGLRLLRQRAGARYVPVTRRFTAMTAAGSAAGHFVTAMALQSADFSIGLLPLLQSLLYCEWHAGQHPEASRDFATFAIRAGSQIRRLSSLLPSHDSFPAIPAACVRRA